MKYADLLKTMRTCPFCDRADSILLENDAAFLTYSLAPYHPDHMLVVPKRHVEHFLEVTEAEMRDIDALEKRGIAALQKLGYENISMLVREGGGPAKSIAHLHYHLIPNIALGDSTHTGSDRHALASDEIEILMKRLRGAVQG